MRRVRGGECVLEEANVGFLARGEVEGNRIQGGAFRGWSTRTGNRSSPLVKCIWNLGYSRGGARRDDWQATTASAMLEIECFSRSVIVRVGWSHPKTCLAGLPLSGHSTEAGGISAPGRALASPLQIFPIQNLEKTGGRFHICDHYA